jgi:hypothetical protein
MNPNIIMGYLKSLIDIIANNRANVYIHRYIVDFKKDKTKHNNDYEEMLIQSENNIRNLLKVQHQLKLSNDTLKTKLEDLEKSKCDLRKEYKNIQEVS